MPKGTLSGVAGRMRGHESAHLQATAQAARQPAIDFQAESKKLSELLPKLTSGVSMSFYNPVHGKVRGTFKRLGGSGRIEVEDSASHMVLSCLPSQVIEISEQ